MSVPQTCVTLPALHVRTDANTLIERLQRGEASAIGEAYDLHAGAVFAFARRLVGDAAAAEDLVHEVFVTLPSAIRRFQGGSSLRTFLVSIAVNHARHHVRAAARRRAALDRYANDPDNDAPDSSRSPEREAMRVDLARVLSVALDALPLDQRVAFVLCEVEERTSREAGEIVGVPEATIRTRVFHAKKKLREELSRRGMR